MKLEKLRKSHKKEIIIGGLIGVSILSVLIFSTTRAKFRTTESIPLVRGTVNYSSSDFQIMAMYQANDSGEYTEINTMPTSGYKINESKSYCTLNSTKDTKAVLKTIAGYHTIANLSKNDKCFLYFDKLTAKDIILAGLTKTTRSDFTLLEANTDGKIYQLEDDDGLSYFYAGYVTKNWVKFANMYWRIIRINGDGTIRLIYSGTTAEAEGTTTQRGTSTFNSTRDDNMYVGYMYTSGQVHGLRTSSSIKKVVDSWYKTNIVDKGYSPKIDANAGFCGDREITSGQGIGGAKTYYGAYTRFYNNLSNPTPTFKCKNSSDLYTVSGAKKTTGEAKGNQALTYPVGLITADEVSAAGAIVSTGNNKYYLYTGQHYWTMTPSYYDNGALANVFCVNSGGMFTHTTVLGSYGVRPVINLKADTVFETGGDGTSTNPYVVQ